ncbi:hypothetical protein CJ030_MR5G018767 [Morella rubra]|uniref:Uncharacterized protein n=1 Tax=Morella rubra TaxID=262757 RepID=A0A6A1VTF6_9ROSI|nr:hypothetical protein CJ030_MR5G018782 [Morella rubra]KAB1214843.1 hypothetical protein CJ030_MR5G018767 [Morella rubra]
MDSEALRLQIEEMRQSLIDEKILNDQLMLVEDIFTPYFIETAMVVYLDNSPRCVDIIEQSLEETPLDPTKLEKFLNKLKYCNRFGAEKVPTEVDKVLECCRGNDKEAVG